MSRQTVVVAILALGMTLVIVTGGIDLSTGSLVALTTVIIAKLLKSGSSPVVAITVAVAVATVIGATIGTFVGRLRMMPFVVTLGAMTALRGAAKGLASEQKIRLRSRAGSITSSRRRSRRRACGSRWRSPSWSPACSTTRASAVTCSRWGSNEAAARLVGIDAGKVKILV